MQGEDEVIFCINSNLQGNMSKEVIEKVRHMIGNSSYIPICQNIVCNSSYSYGQRGLAADLIYKSTKMFAKVWTNNECQRLFCWAIQNLKDFQIILTHQNIIIPNLCKLVATLIIYQNIHDFSDWFTILVDLYHESPNLQVISLSIFSLVYQDSIPNARIKDFILTDSHSEKEITFIPEVLQNIYQIVCDNNSDLYLNFQESIRFLMCMLKRHTSDKITYLRQPLVDLFQSSILISHLTNALTTIPDSQGYILPFISKILLIKNESRTPSFFNIQTCQIITGFFSLDIFSDSFYELIKNIISKLSLNPFVETCDPTIFPNFVSAFYERTMSTVLTHSTLFESPLSVEYTIHAWSLLSKSLKHTLPDDYQTFIKEKVQQVIFQYTSLIANIFSNFPEQADAIFINDDDQREDYVSPLNELTNIDDEGNANYFLHTPLPILPIAIEVLTFIYNRTRRSDDHPQYLTPILSMIIDLTTAPQSEAVVKSILRFIEPSSRQTSNSHNTCCREVIEQNPEMFPPGNSWYERVRFYFVEKLLVLLKEMPQLKSNIVSTLKKINHTQFDTPNFSLQCCRSLVTKYLAGEFPFEENFIDFVFQHSLKSRTIDPILTQLSTRLAAMKLNEQELIKFLIEMRILMKNVDDEIKFNHVFQWYLTTSLKKVEQLAPVIVNNPKIMSYYFEFYQAFIHAEGYGRVKFPSSSQNSCLMFESSILALTPFLTRLAKDGPFNNFDECLVPAFSLLATAFSLKYVMYKAYKIYKNPLPTNVVNLVIAVVRKINLNTLSQYSEIFVSFLTLIKAWCEKGMIGLVFSNNLLVLILESLILLFDSPHSINFDGISVSKSIFEYLIKRKENDWRETALRPLRFFSLLIWEKLINEQHGCDSNLLPILKLLCILDPELMPRLFFVLNQQLSGDCLTEVDAIQQDVSSHFEEILFNDENSFSRVIQQLLRAIAKVPHLIRIDKSV